MLLNCAIDVHEISTLRNQHNDLTRMGQLFLSCAIKVYFDEDDATVTLIAQVILIA